jgi:PDZ domain
MFKHISTTACIIAAVACLSAQSRAQDKTTPAADHSVLSQSSSELMPPDVPQPPAADARPQLNHESTAIDHSAPPVPQQAAPVEHSQPAELGVYMLNSAGPGVRIENITRGSAADKAGLQPGDYILSIDGQAVGTPQQVIEQIHDKKPGDTVNLTVWRNGTEQSMAATLGELRMSPQNRALSNAPAEYSPGPYTTYYRSPVYEPYEGFYPGNYYGYGYYPRTYYYGNPYSYGYRYYGAPRYGFYGSPWRGGVRVGPFGRIW